jgi:hypothetical protein
MRVGVLALQGAFAEHIAVLRRLDVEAPAVARKAQAGQFIVIRLTYHPLFSSPTMFSLGTFTSSKNISLNICVPFIALTGAT